MAIFTDYIPSAWEEAFYASLDSLHINRPKDLKADGKIHRFSVDGKPKNDSGYYVIFQDDVVGWHIGNWSTGDKINGHWSKTTITTAQKISLHEKWNAARAAADKERADLQAKTAFDMRTRLGAMANAPDSHPYLIRKGVKAHGIKIGQQRLYIPMLDDSGQIASAQSIDDKGVKLYAPGGRVKGCYFLLGAPKERLYIAEGYATASSIHEATGEAVMVTFDAGNMDAAISTIKKRFPNTKLTICADNDAKKTINTGLEKAKQAAEKYHAELKFPQFTPEEMATGNPTDFNDYHALRGMSSLKQLFTKSNNTNLFKLLTLEDLNNLPPIEWMIDGVFARNGFSVIYGEPGNCKTFVALDMALSIAAGMQWADRDTYQSDVLYIAGEGVGGLPRRIKAWMQEFNQDNVPVPFLLLPTAVNMMDKNDVEKLIATIDESGKTFGLVIIDTVARSLLGGDENSANDIGAFVAACDAIKDHTGAAVMGIHHSGKDADRGMRGSSALLGAIDTLIQVTRIDEDVFLKMEKQKDAEPMKDMAFKMKQVIVGINQNSIVLEPSDSERPNKKHSGRYDLAYEFLLDCLAQSTDKIRGQTAVRSSIWQDECYRRGLGGDVEATQKRTFYKARKRLHESKIIGVENELVWIIKPEVKND